MLRSLSASFILAILLAGCDSGTDGTNEVRAIGVLSVTDFFEDDIQSPSVRPLFETGYGIATFESTSSDPSIVEVRDQGDGTIQLIAVAVGDATVSVTATVESESGAPVSATSDFTVTVRPQCPVVDPSRDVLPDTSQTLLLDYLRGVQTTNSSGDVTITYRGAALLTPEASCSRGTSTVVYRGTLVAERTGFGGPATLAEPAELRFTGDETEITSEFIDPFDTAFRFGPGQRTADLGEVVTLSDAHCLSGTKEMVLVPGAGFNRFVMHCTERGPGDTFVYSDTEVTLGEPGVIE